MFRNSEKELVSGTEKSDSEMEINQCGNSRPGPPLLDRHPTPPSRERPRGGTKVPPRPGCHRAAWFKGVEEFHLLAAVLLFLGPDGRLWGPTSGERCGCLGAARKNFKVEEGEPVAQGAGETGLG